MDNQITIQALKYGNIRHYEWNTILLEKTDSHIIVLGEYGRKLNHYTKQKVFTVETWTIEYFPFDSWFTVSADVVGGKIHQFYCNINQPAKIEGNTVSFVDLDLDYVQRNGEWKVVDEDEFESNAIKFAYPEALIHKASQELQDLKELVRNQTFPFDGSLEKFIDCIPR
ncbi:DUF402 domain-containing protein [Paenibacillus andongensis]|uniref:DUF402 domain-containing protein n=1 Tax=Paenibacillus andongensis TaxID=2975482 RepID=UPI0021BB4706|nr:DUF402 domain-containing protein [Paenibacillus andongensis]